MSAGAISVHDGRDTLERLSDDDLVSASESAYLQAALVRHRLQAARLAQELASDPSVRLPTCRNCEAACSPGAFFCDTDCRADHHARQRQLARLGNVVS
jgi:hypothetical protein